MHARFNMYMAFWMMFSCRMRACMVATLLSTVVVANRQPSQVLHEVMTTGILTVGPCSPRGIQHYFTHDMACEDIQHQLRAANCWAVYPHTNRDPFPISQITYVPIPVGDSIVERICTNCTFLHQMCVDVSCNRVTLPRSMPALCTLGQIHWSAGPNKQRELLLPGTTSYTQHLGDVLTTIEPAAYYILSATATFAVYASIGTGLLVSVITFAWVVTAFCRNFTSQPTESYRSSKQEPNQQQPRAALHLPPAGQTIVTNVAVNLHLNTHPALPQVSPHVGVMGHALRVSPVEKQYSGQQSESVLSPMPKSSKKHVGNDKPSDDPQPPAAVSAVTSVGAIDGDTSDVEPESAFQKEMEALFPSRMPVPHCVQRARVWPTIASWEF
jgi:hypothetical protein